MELSQMFPKVSSFNICVMDEIKEVRLRKVSLRDHIRCNQEFGGEISDALQQHSGDIDALCRLIYHQILPEDTHFFKSRDAVAITEDGEETKISLGGASLLARYVDSLDLFKEMMAAYQDCLVAGLPIVDEKKK